MPSRVGPTQSSEFSGDDDFLHSSEPSTHCGISLSSDLLTGCSIGLMIKLNLVAFQLRDRNEHGWNI